MKKASLIAAACALFFGAQSLAAQEASQEISYVEDPSQGLLINRMQDNWFITAEGGASVFLGNFASERKFTDRFMPAASLYVGKWFTPVFGARAGVNFMGLKGLSRSANALGALRGENLIDGHFTKTKFNEFGPQLDLMVNLTNWWCGYKPGRIYNATVYAGGGAYVTFTKQYKSNGQADGWKNGHDYLTDVRVGLINSFNVSKQVALSLDLRYTGIGGLKQDFGADYNRHAGAVQAYLGFTYNFKKRDWVAPIVPVIPEPENCDALRARLAAADARIADLEAQLKDCLSRPVETVVENNAPLATVYYPIGVSRLSRENQRVIKAIASVMTQNPDKKYTVTGWADNYTGTDNINIRLRKNRAAGVEKVLLRNGVPSSQITVTTNNGNLSDLGEKCVALDRAVTIEENK